jgi:hypothetical protein
MYWIIVGRLFISSNINMAATKQQLWRQLKNLYSEFEVSNKLKYQTSTKLSIQSEIIRIEDIYESLPRTDEVARTVSLNELIFDVKSSDISFPIHVNDTKETLIERFSKSNLYPFFDQAIVGSKLTTTTSFLNTDLLKRIKLTPGIMLLMNTIRDGIEVSVPITSLDQITDLLSKLEAGYEINPFEELGSDTDTILDLVKFGGVIKFEWLDAPSNNQAAAYFPYFNNTEYNLEDFQIYNSDQVPNEIACLIYSLEKAGIEDDLINDLKLGQVSRYSKLTDLAKVAKIINCDIHVKKDMKQVDRTYSCGNKLARIIHLGMINGHFFLNKQMIGITLAGIRNKIEGLKLQERGKNLTSFEVITYLLKHKEKTFTPITIESITSNLSQYFNYSNDYLNLREPTDSEVTEVNAKTPSKWYHTCLKEECDCTEENVDIYFIDTETTSESGVHKALVLVAQKWGDNKQRVFVGKKCVQKFLDTLTKKSIIYAHNLAFDFSQFISEMSYLSNMIQTGSMVKQAKGSYKKIKVVFKDSYSFLAIKLSDFSKTLNLEKCEKDAYPYSLLRSDTISSIIPMEQVFNHIAPELKDQLISNAKLANCISEFGLDLQKYTVHYCKQDVKILHDGFIKFKEQVINATNLDIRDFVSLPQLANVYQANEGCFDDCYSFSGLPHHFMRKSIVGGRVLLRDNQKQHVVAAGYERDSAIKNVGNYEVLSNDNKIDDFDAVSLYPSAMRRLAYPKGIPSLIKDASNQTAKTLSNLDHYIVEIIVTKVGIKRHMPLLSVVDKVGIRNYTNEVVGKKFVVDKVTLEDLEMFQNIEYEIIQGYQWNSGVNNRISEVIKYMFDQRILEKKKLGGGLQLIWKLLMNSSYGKLIQKPITSTKRFVNQSNYNNFVRKNFKFIKEVAKVSNNRYLFTLRKSRLEHFACPHLGGLVLSMSKRIMNEVICLAEDNELPIYYQDTDSMHIQDAHVEVLRSKFKDKYNREIIGSSMGQFHGDFDAPGKNVKSVEFIGVGKKVYVDRLEYTDYEGIIKESHHIRVKGIPSRALTDYSKANHVSIMYTYEIFKNTDRRIKFDLSKYCVLNRDKSMNYRNSVDLARPPSRTIGFNN